MPAPHRASTSSAPRSTLLLLVAMTVAVGLVLPAITLVAAATPDHLVVSEVVTGGASASDELVELYNPTAAPLPLEGLELVYVSATGATVTRRVTWPAGASLVPPHGHVLVANDLGVFAAIADALYSGGMAATGGSVAVRIQGASSAIDAVGWGSATSTWMEGSAASAPASGESLERLPGGAAGSATDTDGNAADFVVRSVPDPQNLGSPPTPDDVPSPTPMPPTETPLPTAAASDTGSPLPTVIPTPTPPAEPPAIPIATARGLAEGAEVTVEGVSLSASDFTDGGGYLADSSGAIAVLPETDVFARGRAVRVTGEVDDRFGQRTLRVAAGGIVDLGPAVEPGAAAVTTGSVGEAVEGQLVRIDALIAGPPSTLTSGVAFDVDDGSGPTRLVVATVTGIDVTAWTGGTRVDLVGIVGQRDSTGTGSVGYRVQPRAVADVLAVSPPADATPTPSSSAGPSATEPAASPDPGVMTIAEARRAARNTRVRIRGTVTLPTGVVDAQTAVVQDGTAAIVLRLSEEAGSLPRGQRLDVSGARSTKSGMETIRVTTPPGLLGTASDPTPRVLTTGGATEAWEAELVVVRGRLVASARRAATGTVSMEIDDGSGPVRVVAGASLDLDRSALIEGTWIEVRGVLGQETSGAQPTRGYRVWPRVPGDVRVTAAGTDADGGATEASDGSQGDGSSTEASDVGGLADLDGSGAAGAVGATLVVTHWPELGLGGVLWDGDRLVVLVETDATRLVAALAGRPPPVALVLHGLRAVGGPPGLAVPAVALGTQPDAALIVDRPAHAPSTLQPGPGDPPRWFAAVGRLEGSPLAGRLRTAAGILAIDWRCDRGEHPPRGLVTVSGIAVPGRDALLVPCDGIRAGSTLGRSAAATAADVVADVEAASADRATPDATPSAALAAGLLGAAAAVLTGAVAWLRWRPEDHPPDPAEPVEGASEDAPGREALPPASAPPVLTLVTLPHERAP